MLRDTRARPSAESLQVAGCATWAELDARFDGTQHDALEGLFTF